MDEIIDFVKNTIKTARKVGAGARSYVVERKTLRLASKAKRLEERAAFRSAGFRFKKRMAVSRSNLIAKFDPERAEQIMAEFRRRNIARTGNPIFDELSAEGGVGYATDMMRSQRIQEASDVQDQIAAAVYCAQESVRQIKGITREEGSSVRSAEAIASLKEEKKRLKGVAKSEYKTSKKTPSLEDLEIPEDRGLPPRRR